MSGDMIRLTLTPDQANRVMALVSHDTLQQHAWINALHTTDDERARAWTYVYENTGIIEAFDRSADRVLMRKAAFARRAMLAPAPPAPDVPA